MDDEWKMPKVELCLGCAMGDGVGRVQGSGIGVPEGQEKGDVGSEAHERELFLRRRRKWGMECRGGKEVLIRKIARRNWKMRRHTLAAGVKCAVPAASHMGLS